MVATIFIASGLLIGNIKSVQIVGKITGKVHYGSSTFCLHFNVWNITTRKKTLLPIKSIKCELTDEDDGKK